MTSWSLLSCLKACREANSQLAVSQDSRIACPVLRCLATLHPCRHASDHKSELSRALLVVGWEREGVLAITSLEFEFHLQFPCGSPSTEQSDFHQSGRSGKERECKQTLKNTSRRQMTSLPMSSLPIALNFSMQIFKFQSPSCKLSFLFPPAVRMPWRTCSQAIDTPLLYQNSPPV